MKLNQIKSNLIESNQIKTNQNKSKQNILNQIIWFDLIWIDLIWFDLDWFDLIWIYLIWFVLFWFEFDLIWFDLISFDLIWFDLIWFDLSWFHQRGIIDQRGMIMSPSRGASKLPDERHFKKRGAGIPSTYARFAIPADLAFLCFMARRTIESFLKICSIDSTQYSWFFFLDSPSKGVRTGDRRNKVAGASTDPMD